MSSTNAVSKTPGDPPIAGQPASPLKAKLYGLRGSAPTFCAELMLRHKGISYRRANLIPGRHRKSLPAKGFPGGTVPALTLNGSHVQTNRAIARRLDELVPDPPLFPVDPAARAAVEEAERFIDEVLQQATRRMILWSLTVDPDSVKPHPANGRLLVPRNAWLRGRLMPRVFEQYGVTAEVVREDFAELSARLDRIDAYVAEGVLNGPQLTAADFEVAPLIAALMGLEDGGAKIARRPVAALVTRVMPGR
jgi:glutathione S-transferase